MADSFNPIEILEKLSKFLAFSSPIVIYSLYKESLLESYQYMRKSSAFVNVQLTESWLREYQVPSGKGGLHPMMNMSGTGGFLLSSTVVNPLEEDTTPIRPKKQRKI
jgi:tRNA (adenine58-N1)-methyltransferase non-catalytic subunit